MDDIGEWATLRAASSAGGREMVAQGYRVERGSASLVGQAAETRETQVADGDGMPAIRPAAALPKARSATALPLIAAGELVGVLEIQSTEDAAFDQDNVRALEGMAGQLAVAIDNARRFNADASVSETRSPSYRLAQRLAIDKYGDGRLRGGPQYCQLASVLRTHSSCGCRVVAGAVHLVTELRDGKVEVRKSRICRSSASTQCWRRVPVWKRR